jgi:hypothetical protein
MAYCAKFSINYTVPSLEPSLILCTTTVLGSQSSTVPILEPSLISSIEQSSLSSTVSVADTVNDDGPTKAIISSPCHNLRLPVGTEIIILLFAVPNPKPSTAPISAPNELTIFYVTAITIARHFNFLFSCAESSFECTVLIPSEESGPTLISSSLSSIVLSLNPSLISRTNTEQRTLSSPVPSLEPSLISSTSTVQSSLSSPVPSLDPSLILRTTTE